MLSSKENGTEQEVWYLNTHFDHAGPTSRVESAKLILRAVREALGLPDVVENGENHLEALFRRNEGTDSPDDCAGSELSGDIAATITTSPIVLVTGDFNDLETSECYKAMESASLAENGKTSLPMMFDTRKVAAVVDQSDVSTFTGMRGEFAKVIDFVWVAGESVCMIDGWTGRGLRSCSERFDGAAGAHSAVGIRRNSVVAQSWKDKTLASDHAAVVVELLLI